MALILGKDGLKNTTEKYFVYELDWSYLQGLPVGVLLVLLQYVSAESFVKLLFLSKGSRAFMFHTLCGVPQGVGMLNDYMLVLLGRAIHMHRRRDYSREICWTWFTREGRYLPPPQWCDHYVYLVYREYYIRGVMLCHQMFHGVYRDLWTPLQMNAKRLRNKTTEFNQEPNLWYDLPRYGHGLEAEFTDYEAYRAACIRQAEQHRQDVEVSLEHTCDLRMCVEGEEGAETLLQWHVLTPDYTNTAGWRARRRVAE
jgi:hypothetical protein